MPITYIIDKATDRYRLPLSKEEKQERLDLLLDKLNKLESRLFKRKLTLQELKGKEFAKVEDIIALVREIKSLQASRNIAYYDVGRLQKLLDNISIKKKIKGSKLSSPVIQIPVLMTQELQTLVKAQLNDKEPDAKTKKDWIESFLDRSIDYFTKSFLSESDLITI